MEIHAFYFPELSQGKEELIIKDEEFHHLRRVLRLKEGDEIILFNGNGVIGKGEILELKKEAAYIKLRSLNTYPKKRPEIVLFQALIKNERMDFLIEKVSELGVSEILPVQSKNCIVRIKDEHMERKIRHWQRIAIHACKQAFNPWLPKINYPQTFNAALDMTDDDSLKIIFVKEAPFLNDLSFALNKKIILLIGPEGGFCYEEISLACEKGFVKYSLGHLRLRSETAAIVAVTLASYLSKRKNVSS